MDVGPVDRVHQRYPWLERVESYWPAYICGVAAAVVTRRCTDCLQDAVWMGSATAALVVALDVLTRPEPPPAPIVNDLIRQAVLDRLADQQQRAALAVNDNPCEAKAILAEMWRELQSYQDEPWFQGAWKSLKTPAEETAGGRVEQLQAKARQLDEKDLSGSDIDRAEDLFRVASDLDDELWGAEIRARLREVKEFATRLRTEAQFCKGTELSSSALRHQKAVQEADDALQALLESSGRTIGRDVTDNGACLFDACAQLVGGEWTASTLRAAVVFWLDENRQAWTGTLINGETPEQYVARIAKPDEFGGHIELIAIASVTNRTIRVYSATITEPMTELTKCRTDHGEGEIVELFRMRSQRHYLTVLPSEDQSSE
jgi:OTU-like cysteine protease